MAKKAKNKPRSDIPYVERLRINKLAGIAAHRDDAGKIVPTKTLQEVPEE